MKLRDVILLLAKCTLASSLIVTFSSVRKLSSGNVKIIFHSLISNLLAILGSPAIFRSVIFFIIAGYCPMEFMLRHDRAVANRSWSSRKLRLISKDSDFTT